MPMDKGTRWGRRRVPPLVVRWPRSPTRACLQSIVWRLLFVKCMDALETWSIVTRAHTEAELYSSATATPAYTGPVGVGRTLHMLGHGSKGRTCRATAARAAHVGPGLPQAAYVGPGLQQAAHVRPGLHQAARVRPELNQAAQVRPGLYQAAQVWPGLRQQRT